MAADVCNRLYSPAQGELTRPEIGTGGVDDLVQGRGGDGVLEAGHGVVDAGSHDDRQGHVSPEVVGVLVARLGCGGAVEGILSATVRGVFPDLPLLKSYTLTAGICSSPRTT